MHRNGGSLAPSDQRNPPMNWYCVHTKPQREKHAVEQLGNQLGFEVFCPDLRITKTIRRVKRLVIEPLFPRYLFCRFDLGLNFRAVRYAHDVVNLVSFGAQPVVVADQLIQDLKFWVSKEGTLKTQPFLSSGDRVQIIDGPMQGLQAVILEGRSDCERVAVLLSILGNEARLMIDRDLLAKTA